MPQHVYLGPARSGKTTEVLNAYRDALVSGDMSSPPSRVGMFTAIWLAPNARDAALIRGHLLGGQLQSCLRPGVMTFHDLSALIIAESRRRTRHLPPLLERELMRRVVNQAVEQQQLKFFGEAAGRSGFIDLVVEHVRELKRAAVSPEFYAKARSVRGSAEQQQELALVYRNYEALLSAHELTDEDGSHWIARDLLAAGSPACLQQLKLVVADGFTDFTPIQHEILKLLSARTNQLIVTLPHEGPAAEAASPWRGEGTSAARADLFAKTTATRNAFRREWDGLKSVLQVEREFPARPLKLPAIDHAVRHIFRNPAKVPAPSADVIDSLSRCEIVSAAGAHDEIVQVARRIKQRLSSGASLPDDIAVVFRTLGDAASRVREVFAECGIPHYLDADLPIATAPLMRTLLSLLRLADENWPFRRVVAVITNNTLTSFDAAARQAADWLVRDLQLADGADALLDRVEQLAAVDTPPEKMGEHLQRRVTAARKALPVIQLLSSALGELPREATAIEWGDAIAKLGSHLGLFRPLPEGEGSDVAAWHLIRAHLAALERLDAWLGQPPRKLGLREILSALAEVAANGRLPRRHDDVGRVRVLGAQAARTLSVKHLYLAGMSEQSFPSPERPGRLATDAYYRFLARAMDQKRAAKADSAPSPTRAQEEMLLFYELLSRAEESLTISYPALDDRAQDLPPSPYVTEFQRVFGEAGKKHLRTTPPQLSPLPDAHDAKLRNPCSPSDWRIQAVAAALEQGGDARLLAGIFAAADTKSLAAAIDAGLRVTHARAHGESFGSAEGLLTSPAAAARLARRFGADHLWSPSQWETYAGCPYKFFLQDVLGLEPLADLVVETDFTRRGSRLHHVLATFHRQWPERRGPATMSADEERARFIEHLYQVIDERLPVALEGGVDAALAELDRRQIRRWAEKHFDHHVNYGGTCAKRGAAMTSSRLEYRFGPARPGDDDSDPNSAREAFVLEVGGEKIRITGQIDRVDIGTLDGRTVFNVIDYKSGKKPAFRDEHIESGERLQLPIYVAAAQSLIFKGKAEPLIAGYWSMAGGFDAKGALAARHETPSEERWQAIRQMIEDRVVRSVAEIRRGDFPVASRDEKCTSYCEFNTVCRIAQIRSLGKVWSPDNASTASGPAQ